MSALSGVTPEMVRLVYPTSLSDAALDQLISQAEEELASVIGPLVGPIQQRFQGAAITSVILARRVAAADLLLTAGAGPVPGTDWILSLDARRVDNVGASAWSDLVAAYTPDDLLTVQSTVIDMTVLSGSMAATGGLTSEKLGEYSYQALSPVDLEATRRAMFRRFKYLGFGPAYTTRLVPVGVTDTWSLASMLAQSCIPRKRTDGPEDEYGHPAAVWVDGPPQRCSVQTAKSMGYRHGETRNPYEALPMVVYYNVYFERNSILSERDRFVLDGLEYELDLIVGDASGRSHHQEGQCHVVRAG